MIDSGHASLSIARQCELVSISRSGFYYQPTGETGLNLTLTRWRTSVSIECSIRSAARPSPKQAAKRSTRPIASSVATSSRYASGEGRLVRGRGVAPSGSD
jgi:hypothetical protein